MHLHTEPEGKPESEVGRSAIEIDKLLTKVVQDLFAVILEPTIITQLQPFVELEFPPKIADAQPDAVLQYPPLTVER